MKYAIIGFGWAVVGLLMYLSGVWMKASDAYSADFAAATSANGIGLTLLAAAMVAAVLMVVYMHLINAISAIRRYNTCKCDSTHAVSASSESNKVT
jgi:hypothetical protein